MCEMTIPALGGITQEASKSDYWSQDSEVDEDHTGQRLKCRNMFKFKVINVLGASNKSDILPASY